MKKHLPYIIAVAGSLLGLAIVYYAFELVNIPSSPRYSEPVYIIVGMLLLAGSVLYGVFHKK